MEHLLPGEAIRKLLEEFLIHPHCMAELLDLMKTHKGDKRLLAKLEGQLKTLHKYRASAADRFPKTRFERLKQAGGLCSMHIDTKEINWRVLYSCLPNGTILLHGFFERAGKSATDYSAAIPKAQRRLHEWMEENKHG